MLGNVAIALFVYPGLLFMLLLAFACTWLMHGRRPVLTGVLRGLRLPAPLGTTLLTLVGALLLPWPLHPLNGMPAVGAATLVWGLLEVAFLLPLLHELTADEGGRVRAASREGQMGAAGRALLWLAVGAGLWAGTNPVALPGRLLLALAATLALPQSLGWGPFSAERSVWTAQETQLGPAMNAAIALRATALITAVALVWVPVPLVGNPQVAVALTIAVALGLAAGLRWLDGRLPRLPLPLALRFGWQRTLPLALVGVAYIALFV